ELTIEDDGIGFDPNRPYPGHLGLRSMRERVASLDGVLTIDSTLGAGTTVRVRVPLLAVSPDGFGASTDAYEAAERNASPSSRNDTTSGLPSAAPREKGA